MPSSDLVTRDKLRSELVKNAAAKPLNIIVPAVLVVAGLALQIPLIVTPIALITYLVLVAQAFFDEGEAEKVGQETYAKARGEQPAAAALDAQTLSPAIARPLKQARQTAAAIRQAIKEADQPFDDVTADVDALVSAMETSARRAQLITKTIADQEGAGQSVRDLDAHIQRLRGQDSDPDVRALIVDLQAQRDALMNLQGRLDKFAVGMERICASLGLMRTRLAQMSASEEEAAQRELARQSRELRQRTDLLAESIAEVFADDDSAEGEHVDLPAASPQQTLASRRNRGGQHPTWM